MYPLYILISCVIFFTGGLYVGRLFFGEKSKYKPPVNPYERRMQSRELENFISEAILSQISDEELIHNTASSDPEEPIDIQYIRNIIDEIIFEKSDPRYSELETYTRHRTNQYINSAIKYAISEKLVKDHTLGEAFADLHMCRLHGHPSDTQLKEEIQQDGNTTYHRFINDKNQVVTCHTTTLEIHHFKYDEEGRQIGMYNDDMEPLLTTDFHEDGSRTVTIYTLDNIGVRSFYFDPNGNMIHVENLEDSYPVQ